MAWLSGLAGKAEEVLNTIDRSTAAVLRKEDGLRRDMSGMDSSTLLEVRSLPPDSNLTVEEFLRNESRFVAVRFSLVFSLLVVFFGFFLRRDSSRVLLVLGTEMGLRM